MTDSATNPETGVGDGGFAPIDSENAVSIQAEEESEHVLSAEDETVGESDPPDDIGEDDFVDIEHDGRAYKIPAALKNAFLRNADYTRKTQALADMRRELDGHKQTFAADRAAMEQHLGDYARLRAIGEQIAACENLDWANVARTNPQLAQQAFQGLTRLKQLGGSLAAELKNKQLQQAVAEERTRAISVEQGRAVLAREISGWSPELGQKLADYAVDAFGFAPQEVGSVMDPRMIKVLHAAWRAAETEKSAERVKHIQTAQSTRPATEVRAGAGNHPRNPERMNHAEYRRWRNRADT